MNIKISSKEKAVLNHLLKVGESGWFTDEVLPDGIQSVGQAEQLVKSLQHKLNPNDYYEKNHITNVSGVGIQKL